MSRVLFGFALGLAIGVAVGAWACERFAGKTKEADEGTYRRIVELAQAALAIPSQKEESEAAK